MLDLILLTVVLYGVVRIFSCPTRRKLARAGADRIINGEEPASEGNINKTITSLLSSKTFGFNLTETDFQRAEKLREIRSGLRKSLKTYEPIP